MSLSKVILIWDWKMWNDRHMADQKCELIAVLVAIVVPDFWIESVTNAEYNKLMGVCRGGDFSIVSKHFADTSPKAFRPEEDAVCHMQTDRNVKGWD